MYRSDNRGESWQKTAVGMSWVFNIKITPDGVVYCTGVTGVWRSTNHGKSWTQLASRFGQIGWPPVIGLEVDPRNSKTIWISVGPSQEAVGGGVFKTTDGGITWNDFTGDLPYRKPMVLRFNPETNNLWAGGVRLFKIKQ